MLVRHLQAFIAGVQLRRAVIAFSARHRSWVKAGRWQGGTIYGAYRSPEGSRRGLTSRTRLGRTLLRISFALAAALAALPLSTGHTAEPAKQGTIGATYTAHNVQ